MKRLYSCACHIRCLMCNISWRMDCVISWHEISSSDSRVLQLGDMLTAVNNIFTCITPVVVDITNESLSLLTYSIMYYLIKYVVLCIFMCLMSALTDESGLPGLFSPSSHNHLISLHLVSAIIIFYLRWGGLYGDGMYFYKCHQSYIIANYTKSKIKISRLVNLSNVS